MPVCYQCRIEIQGFPYRCKFCGMTFCSKHRLPENHTCPFDLIRKGNVSLESPLYQDALEYVNKELSVAKIYEYVTTKQMDKIQAVELLNYFLENNEDPEIRIISIFAFKELDLNSNNAFKVLESCLLSDENNEVRKATKETILNLFPKKSKALLEWLNKHEKILDEDY
ncbi:MAG: AN1-type zinc finger domain-containing protein [Promethearchaeota archaeon]